MQATDIGVVLTFPATADGDTVDYTGATSATLVYLAPDGTRASAALTIDSVSSVHYTTTGTDFTQTGTYSLQVVVNYTGGAVYRSPVIQLQVGPTI